MNWFFIAIASPFIWGITNYIDKLAVSRYSGKVKYTSFIMTSGIFISLVAVLIALINPSVLQISWQNLILILISGIFSMIYLLPYYHAINSEDTSIVVPMYQMIPIMGLILAFVFLHERLKIMQIAAGLLIVVGAIGLSLDLGEKIKLKRKIFALMFLSSLLVSIDVLFYKIVALRTNYWTAIFWGLVGWFLCIIFFLLKKSTRQDFLNGLRYKKLIFLVGSSEMMSLGAGWLFSYAYLLAPVALVQFLGSLQVMFVFLIGLIIGRFFPNFVEENIQKKFLLQKIIFIAVILLGSFILYRSS